MQEYKMPKREQNSNKGTFGKVLNFAGSKNYIGAAYLSTISPLKVGAGFVALASDRDIIKSVSALLPEAIYISSKQGLKDIEKYSVVLIGCGLGNNKKLFEKVIKSVKSPLVVDADGLNIWAGINNSKTLTPHPNPLLKERECATAPQLTTLLNERERAIVPQPTTFFNERERATAPQPTTFFNERERATASQPTTFFKEREQVTVITPHPLEAARLLGVSLEDILSNLEASAKKLCEKYNCITVLKTHRTIICDGKEIFVNQHGNSALAKAGSGDVLAGIIAGLLAQKMDAFEAAKLGVYLHSRAGEIASEELTEYGVLASDLPKYLHKAIKEIL